MSGAPLTARAAAVLTVPPVLWAGNVVLARVFAQDISPMTLNLARWAGALLVLLALAGWALKPSVGMWRYWRRFAVLGLLGVGLYNSFQYLALQTSTPLNVTLVASSLPLFTIVIGRLFFHAVVTRHQVIGAGLSMLGVIVVMAQGSLTMLREFHLVPGDGFALLATFAWAFYGWLLPGTTEPARVRSDWAAMLLSQVVFGVGWCALFSATEWTLGAGTLKPGWPLAAAVLFIIVGPAVLAFATYGTGVKLAGPTVAGFFTNLVPVIVAVLSVVFLDEPPRLYHLVAFALIVAGIVVSARQRRPG